MKDNKVRLQKFIADNGIASRRKAEELIAEGRVKVNGRVASIGDKVDPIRDNVQVRGKVIRVNTEKKYIMLHKPRGFVTTMSDELDRKCVAELVKDLPIRVLPVGRLDRNSEGLLIMTNDGELANKLTHPSSHVNKTYRVTVNGKVSDEQMEILTSALVIDDYKIQPVAVSISGEDESGTVLKMTLFEGRNRQIRKMCEAAGLTVKRLSRISIGNLKLDGLPVGKWRYLEQHEVDYLYKATKETSGNV